MKVDIDSGIMTLTPETQDEAYTLTAWMIDFFSEEGTSEMQMAIPKDDYEEFQALIDSGGVKH